MKFVILILATIATMNCTPLNAYAGCGGWFSSSVPLSSYMKNILANGIPIGVHSNTLNATFDNLIIKWDSKSGGETPTGGRPNLTSLEGATGYTIIRFQLNSPLTEIPNLAYDISTFYANIKDTLRITNVEAELRFNDNGGNIIDRLKFELRQGKNRVSYCNFHKLKAEVASVSVELKSYDVSYNGHREWK